MKNFFFISIASAITIFVIFTIVAFERKNDPQIAAFNQSLFFERKGDLQNAIKELLNIYNENKNDYLINLRLGWLYYLSELYNESLNYYQRAIEIKNNSIEAKIGATYPLSKLEKWEEVRNIYQQILILDPQNYTANLRLGQYYLLRGNYSEANKYLSISYNNFPSDYESNLSYGWTQYYIGNRKKAKELFKNVLMISPNDSLATIGFNLSK